MHRNRIAVSIALLERLVIDIQHIAASPGADAAAKLITFRRQYSQAFKTLTEVVQEGLAAMPTETAQPLTATFRKMSGELRAAVAEQQARWSAANVASDAAAYAQYSARSTGLLQALLAWLKRELLPVV